MAFRRTRFGLAWRSRHCDPTVWEDQLLSVFSDWLIVTDANSGVGELTSVFSLGSSWGKQKNDFPVLGQVRSILQRIFQLLRSEDVELTYLTACLCSKESLTVSVLQVLRSPAAMYRAIQGAAIRLWTKTQS